MANRTVKRSEQESIQACSHVYDLNDFASDGDPVAFDMPSRAVRFNTGGTYKVYFAGRDDVAISQTYADGQIEESQIIKITDTDDALVDAGKVFIYY